MSWARSCPKVVIMWDSPGEGMLTSGLSNVLTARAVGSSPPQYSTHDRVPGGDYLYAL
jgi:hypothetical protein